MFYFIEKERLLYHHTMKRTQITALTTVVLLLFSLIVNARNIDVNVSPGNWWIGLKYNTITLVASGNFAPPVNVGFNHQGVSVDKIYSGDNSNYLFIDITIEAGAQTGIIPITFSDARGNQGTYNFQLFNRENRNQTRLTAEDIIYQIIPDRFCNSNTKNDKESGFFEVNDRLNPVGIHGGDLNGITTNLDYIQQLGMTCIDLLPVMESNLMSMSYQRNGITDFYKIDARLGDINSYQQLIYESRKRGLKFIQNMVFHQTGKYHDWYVSKPNSSFFYADNLKYKSTNNYILNDPYASEYDKERAFGEWSEINMPSLNQNDRILKKLLIQYGIWWLESSQADALKIDKIEHNSVGFLSQLFSSLSQDFPNLSIVADSNPEQNGNALSWQDIALRSGIDKKNIHITDYELASTLSNAFSIFEDSQEGVYNLYAALTTDSKYTNAFGNIVMADNHQLSRLYSNADKEIDQAKMMAGYILTTRGIPSITYGTEWLLDGTINKGKGAVRKDFPGGWPDDSKNGFLQSGFSSNEKSFYEFIHRVLNWRNKNAALFSGELIQFAPIEGIYAYARKQGENTALIIINNTESPFRARRDIYAEVLTGYTWAYDVASEARFDDFTNILIEAKSIMILHLRN